MSAKLIEGMNNALNSLESSNISEVIRGLNYILQKSFEANEISNTNNVIYIEQFPRLLLALGTLLDVINPLGKIPFQKYLGNEEQNYYSFLLGSTDSMLANNPANEWKTDLPGSNQIEFKFLASQLDSNQLLTTIISILRNLSFEIANEVYIAYHSTIMRHLVSVMIASVVEPRLNENLQLVVELLLNISSKIEFTGKKRMQLSNGYLDEHSASAGSTSLNNPNAAQVLQQQKQQKDLLKLKMAYEMSSDSLIEYSLACKTLLPLINAIISPDLSINRYYIIKCLELLLKLSSNTENESLFQNCPLEFLENLVLLLSVPNTTIIENNLENNIIPENFIIQGDPYGKTRPILGLSTPTLQTQQQHLTQAQQNLSTISSSGTIPSSITTTNFSNYAGSSNIPGTNSATPADRIAIPNSIVNDQIDIELRDLAIESLHFLCRISKPNRQKVASIPNAIQLIYKIAVQPFQNLNYFNNYSKIGNLEPPSTNGNNSNIINVNPIKSEMNTKAAYLFTLFATVPEAQNIFKAYRSELYLLACSDDIFADLVCNKLAAPMLLPPPMDPYYAMTSYEHMQM